MSRTSIPAKELADTMPRPLMPVISRPRHHRHVRAHLRPLSAIFTNTLSPIALRLLFRHCKYLPFIFTHARVRVLVTLPTVENLILAFI